MTPAQVTESLARYLNDWAQVSKVPGASYFYVKVAGSSYRLELIEDVILQTQPSTEGVDLERYIVNPKHLGEAPEYVSVCYSTAQAQGKAVAVGKHPQHGWFVIESVIVGGEARVNVICPKVWPPRK